MCQDPATNATGVCFRNGHVLTITTIAQFVPRPPKSYFERQSILFPYIEANYRLQCWRRAWCFLSFKLLDLAICDTKLCDTKSYVQMHNRHTWPKIVTCSPNGRGGGSVDSSTVSNQGGGGKSTSLLFSIRPFVLMQGLSRPG